MGQFRRKNTQRAEKHTYLVPKTHDRSKPREHTLIMENIKQDDMRTAETVAEDAEIDAWLAGYYADNKAARDAGIDDHGTNAEGTY